MAHPSNTMTRRLTRALNTPLPSAGDVQLVIQNGFPRIRDANGLIYRLRPEPGDASGPGQPGDMRFDADGLHIRKATGWETIPFDA